MSLRKEPLHFMHKGQSEWRGDRPLKSYCPGSLGRKWDSSCQPVLPLRQENGVTVPGAMHGVRSDPTSSSQDRRCRRESPCIPLGGERVRGRGASGKGRGMTDMVTFHSDLCAQEEGVLKVTFIAAS